MKTPAHREPALLPSISQFLMGRFLYLITAKNGKRRKIMPLFKPVQGDPERCDVQYDYEELKKLWRNAKDIFMFSKMMEERAHNMNRLRAFWDEEMACMARIYSQLTVPFEKFFLTTINAAGDIAINRKHDPQYEDETIEEPHLVNTREA